MISSFLSFLAFLLLFLVSLSLPIINSIYLFRLRAYETSLFSSSASGTVTFGLWGYCLSPIQLSVAGIQHSSASYCTKPRLGFRFDSRVADALRVSRSENLINRSLTAVLVLHPIACIFTFATLSISLFLLYHRRTDRSVRAHTSLSLGILIFTAFLTTLVFFIDIVLVAVVRNKINNASDGVLTLTWGNAVWMSLAATIALWSAILTHVFTRRRKSKVYNNNTHASDEPDGTT